MPGDETAKGGDDGSCFNSAAVLPDVEEAEGELGTG